MGTITAHPSFDQRGGEIAWLGKFKFGSPVSDGIEFQTANPLPRITRIFANWFENSRELAKFAANFLVGGDFPVKNGRALSFYF